VRRFALAGVVVVGLVAPASASAAWSLGAGGGASASVRAEVLPAAGAPTVFVSGRDVTVSWSQVSYHGVLLGQLAQAGYRVRRSPGMLVPGASCDALVTGGAATLSCTERGLAPGSYSYAALPAFQGWSGQGAQSTSVTVQAPALALSGQTTFTALPATLSGTLSGFLDNEPVSYHLDSPTGPTLTGTPASIPATGGSASATITIPTGTAVGAHTLYALGANGSQATAPITYAPAPTATTLSIANGGTLKKPDQGDTITITYSQPIKVSSFCSTWTNDTQNQTLTTSQLQLVKVGTTATKIQLAAGDCGGGFNLGTIDGLSKNYTSATITYTNSTITWTAATKQLKITLGTPSATTTAVNTTSTATYTPAAGLQSTNATPIDTASKPTQSAVLF
jgi:hypothetical protein